MKLLEIFDVQYAIRRIGPNQFEVAKFDGHKEPTVVYTVTQKTPKLFHSDSPGFLKVQQQEKSVRLVKKFIEDGEPAGAYYSVDGDKITSMKFLDLESES